MSTEQDLIYDGYAVYQGLTDQAKARTSADNVSDVLDSLHRLTKAARQQALPSGYVKVPAACTSEMEDAYDRACLRDGLSAVYLHLPAYEAMLAAAPQAEQVVEAVAWQLRLPDGHTLLEYDYPSWAEGEDGYSILPLYTAPPAPDVSVFPMQPIEWVGQTIRFKENRIVRHLLEYSRDRGCGLNELARMDFTEDERMQVAQLIGYSVCGYGDLSYASRETVERADAIAEALAAHQNREG